MAPSVSLLADVTDEVEALRPPKPNPPPPPPPFAVRIVTLEQEVLDLKQTLNFVLKDVLGVDIRV